jgi:hypothetical protein
VWLYESGHAQACLRLQRPSLEDAQLFLITLKRASRGQTWMSEVEKRRPGHSLGNGGRLLPAGLLLLFVLLALAYTLVTPLFEAPDEVWHYAYVRYVAEGRGLPALDGNASGAGQEVAQPPLYYAAAASIDRLVADDDLSELMWHNPGFGYQAGGTVNDNKNMLIHTARERFPWSGAVLALRLGRFVSLVFGLLTVVAAWGLGREAFADHPGWALSVAAVVAFTPQFLFISGVTSNDSTAAACATAALWGVSRAANRGFTLRRSLLAGLLIGLAVLAKTSNLLLLALAAMALVVARRPPRSGDRPAARYLSAVVGHLALIALVAAAVGGWWYLRNALLYGDPLAVRVHVDTLWGRSTPASVTTLLAELPKVFRSFWGGFGWGHVEFASWVYLALGAVLATGLVGWGWAWKQRRLTGQGRVFLLAAVWWILLLVALLAWMRQVEAPHGRLLFPAIGAGALLLVGGWGALPQTWLRPLLPAGLLVLGTLAPWTVIRPAFAPPELVSSAEAASTVRPVDLVYGGAARLLGVDVDGTSVNPGSTMMVRACWEAVLPVEQDYTVFLHLVGRDNARVAERYTYPGLGRFPTSLWPVGQAFCDVYRVPVEEWAPVPELYDLLIGLFDASTGERLAAQGARGDVGRFPAVAQVRVAPERSVSASPERPLEVRLGEQVTLVGYRLSGPIRSRASLTVTLYWRADAPPDGEYKVFVHLLDETGQLLAQHDGAPRYGRYPTSAWRAGDVIPDEHVLEVPPLAPGQHPSLVAGMYHADTLVRLPVSGPGGPVPDSVIPLAVEFP